MAKAFCARWSIRRATPEEHDHIREFQKRQRRPCRSDSLIQDYFVAVSGHEIVGCAAVRKRNDIGYLYGLVVEKAWRRKGIGHALTWTRLDWLLGENVATVFVMAMFWNIRFFRKHGFALSEKRRTEELAGLHCDFRDAWSSRSALLSLELPSRKAHSEASHREK